MLGAAIGLDQGGLLQAHLIGHAADDAGLGIADILGHAAVVVVLIAQHIVGLAHPVVAVLAETALAAGDDLVGGDAVAQLIAGDVLAHLDDAAKELVAGDEGGLDPGGLHVVAPEHGRTVLALQVAGAHAAGLGLDDDVVGPALGSGILQLQTVVVFAVGHQGLHGLGDASSYCHNSFPPRSITVNLRVTSLKYQTSNFSHTVSRALLTAM